MIPIEPTYILTLIHYLPPVSQRAVDAGVKHWHRSLLRRGNNGESQRAWKEFIKMFDQDDYHYPGHRFPICNCN